MKQSLAVERDLWEVAGKILAEDSDAGRYDFPPLKPSQGVQNYAELSYWVGALRSLGDFSVRAAPKGIRLTLSTVSGPFHGKEGVTYIDWEELLPPYQGKTPTLTSQDAKTIAKALRSIANAYDLAAKLPDSSDDSK